ncbi:MAG: hypothetical protein JWQ35_1813 [Bacteriovoracaceae bacterium]|nr:hypothetical protein [Bacteriovoracaceae bacterium]
MNGVLIENLEHFFKRYPKERARITAVAELEYESHFRLEEHNGESQLIEDNTLIDSTLQGFFPPLTPGASPARLLFINGFGLGCLFEQTLKKPFPETEEYIVIEPSVPRFLFALQQTRLDQLFAHPKIHWIIGLKESDLAREFFVLLSDRDRLQKANAYQMRNHPVIEALHPGYFNHVKSTFEMALDICKKSHGFLSDSLEGLRNTIGNLDWLQKTPGIHLLKNKFKNIPAIIISTGPSLKKSLPILKELQHRALLLSADASLKILIQNEIHPHFVFCLERDEGSKPFFVDIPREKAKANLVVFPLVPSTVIQAYPGPHFAVYRQYGYYRFFEDQAEKGMLQCGPSVAHMALAFADYAGCDRAFLVGQDLAYDPENFSSHPPGISYEEWSHASSEKDLQKKLEAAGDQLLWAPGNLREKVPTSGYYEAFRLNFGEVRDRLSLNLINCTEGGAKIPGIEWKPFAEATRNFQPLPNFFEQISALKKGYQGSEKIKLEIIDQSIQLAQTKLDQIFQNMGTKPTLIEISTLREEQKKLQRDPVFMALTGVFSGRRLIELEWEWNSLFEGDTNSISKQVEILSAWHKEISLVLQSVQKTLR